MKSFAVRNEMLLSNYFYIRSSLRDIHLHIPTEKKNFKNERIFIFYSCCNYLKRTWHTQMHLHTVLKLN